MEQWSDQFFAFVFNHLPVGRGELKQMFADHGLGSVWNVTRDYVLSYRIWLFGLVPCLLLERWWPAVRQNEARRASRRLDILYPVLAGLLAAPFINEGVEAIKHFYLQTFPFLNTGLLDGKPLWLQMLGAFLIYDFTFYVSHRLRHEVKWLWHFHAIHHSQENLNPMSNHRFHFVERLSMVALRTFPVAFVGGAPITWTTFIIVNHFWDYFVHANVATNLGPLRFVLVTPQFHRVHHSVQSEHVDHNYGDRLIVWDWLFGSMVRDFQCYPATGVPGIERWMVEDDYSWKSLPMVWMKQTLYPFYKIGAPLLRRSRKSGRRLCVP